MLSKRNLDDQTYRSIVEAALGRLPWLCPAWTDHNAHDPGVTILELMAWYKEMQQYQMNQFTDGLKETLLKLTGVFRRPAEPARCSVILPEDGLARPAGARLETPEGIPFELNDLAPARRAAIRRVQAGGVELWEMLQSGSLTFHPFEFGGRENTELRIGLDWPGGKRLRVWFQVEDPEGVPRSPFGRPDQQPRELRWIWEGAGEIQPLLDETHALSQSGFVEFAPPEDCRAALQDSLIWLSARQQDPGCEERVRLSGLSVCRWQAGQRETWAKSFFFEAPGDLRWTGRLDHAMARDAQLAVFIRRGDRWEQTAEYETEREPMGRLVRLNTQGTDQNGEKNIWIVCLDPARYPGLIFDTAGLPGETLSLHLEGKQVLPETFHLLCETLDTDGEVRPLPWRCVDSLAASGPRDRVFAYDPLRETITFGDGERGALVQKGEGSVLVTGMVLSLCGGANIPAGAGLRFVDDGREADNAAAVGGVDRETVDEAAARFLRELGDTQKCASAADYEHLARTTPGLRVAAAKALPGYDPDEPSGNSRAPTVTVVAVPASPLPRSLPDARFLSEVQARLDRLRPICTRVRVISPVYEDIYVAVRLRGGEPVTEAAVRRLLEGYLSAEDAGIGGPVRQGEVQARLQALPGVLQVLRVDLRAPGPGCYQRASGDILLPRHAIPFLRELKLERIPEERSENG